MNNSNYKCGVCGENLAHGYICSCGSDEAILKDENIMQTKEFSELVYLAAETYSRLHGSKLSPLNVIEEMHKGNENMINSVLHLLDAVTDNSFSGAA